MPAISQHVATAGELTAMGSVPTGDGGFAPPSYALELHWHVPASSTGTYYYRANDTWRPGKTFDTSTDGQVLVQAVSGERQALHFSSGAPAAVVYEWHATMDAR